MTGPDTVERPGPLAVVGGPLGRHASARARSWLATVAPLLVVSTGAVALGIAQRAHCVAAGWNGSDQFWHGCFSDLPALYRIGNLHAGVGGYLATSGQTAQLDHPVLTGAVMALVGGLVPEGSVLDQTRWYFGIWAVLAAILVAATVYLTAASRPRHVADAALVAASPLLVLVPLVSADIVGVTLVAAGLWAWASRRPVLAGAARPGRGGAHVPPPRAARARAARPAAGRLAGVWRALGGAAAGLGLVLLPFLVSNPEAILRPYAAWWRAEAGLGGMWIIPQLLGHALPSGAVTALAIAGLVVAVLAGAAFALGSARRPTSPRSRWSSWPSPWSPARATPCRRRCGCSRWPPCAASAGATTWSGSGRGPALRDGVGLRGRAQQGRPRPAPGWYAVFVALRVAAVLYLAWRVWHTAALRPAHEPQEEWPGVEPDPDSDAVVDELAGPFTDAPDRLIVRLG